ncbi:aminoglycoside phosphotransferase family protein [Roseibium sp.]|uniref:aminoglycoside phosphotransferase family protein n=1 Tax=Roseibium sp. TaxID=1936156 RepID=UPI003A96C400
MSNQVPENLKALEVTSAGKNWIDALPNLVDVCVRHWDLENVGAPFGGSTVSLAFPAVRDAVPVVVKLQFPHDECRFEADALKVWNGNGAVRLFGHLPEHNALLLEHAQPGTYLSDNPNIDHLGVVADLLKRLWVTTDFPFKRLCEQSEDWTTAFECELRIATDTGERRLIRHAQDLLQELLSTPMQEVLVHQDLHGQNIVSAQREPWLIIDPKPLMGEKAFGLAPIVRSFEFGNTKSSMLYRLDRMSEELGINRERARSWTVVQTLAWGFEPRFKAKHRQIIEWLIGTV